MSIPTKITALCAVLLMSSLSGFAQSYKLPDRWVGEKSGETIGNPYMEDDRPLWRLYQVYPGEWMGYANYLPMRWTGRLWQGLHVHSSHPHVRVSGGVLETEIRSAWGGGNNPEPKISALAFIAPTKGLYRVDADLLAKIWDKSRKHVGMFVVRRDTGSERVVLIADERVSTEEPKRFYDLVPKEFALERGDELVIGFYLNNENAGATIKVSSFAITEVFVQTEN